MVEGGADALGEGGIRVGRVLSSFFPGDEPEMLADVFGVLAGLMQAGVQPARLSWNGSR